MWHGNLLRKCRPNEVIKPAILYWAERREALCKVRKLLRWRKEDKSYFNKLSLCGVLCVSQLLALDEVSGILLWYKENIFYTRDLTLAVRLAERRNRRRCLNPFCKFLRLKIILMSKWHILEWYIPSSSVCVTNSWRSRVFWIQKISF